MALRFLDSFDHYTTPTQKYEVAPGPPTIVAGAARTGACGLRIPDPDYYVRKTLDAQGTWILGIAYRVGGAPGTNYGILSTEDAGTVQGCVRVNAGLTLSLMRGGVAGTVVATSVQALLQNVYYHIEFKHIIDNAAGTLEVRVDGVVWATFAGDTQVTANATANQVTAGPRSAGVGMGWNFEFDDFHALDGTGGAPWNDYLGDRQVECLLPDGVGNYTEWTTLVGAATHWQACDEVPPDEDTSYVDTATLNHRDTFTFSDLSVAAATINGVQVCIRARKTGAGAANIARMYRRVADHQGANVALQTSYAYHLEILEQDPQAGPGAWTLANVNAAEFGFRAT